MNPADIPELADAPERGAAGGSSTQAWLRFTRAGDDGDWFAAWLALLAGSVADARAALLLVADDAGDPFTVAAAWPDPGRDLQYLGPLAERTLTERRGVVAAADGSAVQPGLPAQVGYPVDVGGQLRAAVVLDMAPCSAAALQAALQQLHWASAWLLHHFGQQALQRSQARAEQAGLLNELMATALQQRRLQASALAVANELARRLHCDRVAVGFEHQDRIAPLALSHTAHFDVRSDLARALGQAMDEALDLGQPLAVPPPPRAPGTDADDDAVAAVALAQAASSLGSQAMLAVPVADAGQTLGAITFERRAGPPFSAAEQALAVAAGLMLGPPWALQRRDQQPLPRRAWTAGREFLQMLLGPRHPGLKLLGGLLSAAVLFLALWPVDHRVSARAVVEGARQRASVAPFDGFIAEAPVRAGQSVQQGQLLARLDDRDLQLERQRWLAEQAQAQRRFQVALAQADRGAMGVLSAQVRQAGAQLALVDDQLARARLTAAFDGVVVSGDLRQRIGTPVTLGETLFELVPAEAFRVVMQVEDRDIARLAVGQPGQLLLTSLPSQPMAFTVRAVTSVAGQADGKNVFEVEAEVPPGAADLRPGMEGVAKVLVGRRSQLWVWTHGLVDWLRLALWTYLP